MILTDSRRSRSGTTLPGGGTLGPSSPPSPRRPEIGGVVVDVASDARVAALKQQADDNPACPFAKNLVAEEIKGIVDSYRRNPGLRYVVIVGSDDAIPFFRYPDQSLLGQESGYVPPVESDSPSEASLRRDFVLSQDAYGAETRISLRTTDFPVPDLAVGRLVETPAEIAGLLDAYTAANGVVAPRSSLVTGYDFLADAATPSDRARGGHRRSARHAHHADRKSPQDPASWTASAARDEAARQPPRRDLPRRPLQRQQRARRRLHDEPAHDRPRRLDGNLANSIVFSAGCHAGYNLVDARRHPRRDAAARLGAGVRAEEGDADRGNGLSVRRHRLPRVQRAALPQLRAAAARRHGGRVGRRGAGAGEARLPGDDARHPRHPREGAAGGDRVRAADARREHAGRTRPRARRRAERSRPSRSPQARLRLSA